MYSVNCCEFGKDTGALSGPFESRHEAEEFATSAIGTCKFSQVAIDQIDEEKDFQREREELLAIVEKTLGPDAFIKLSDAIKEIHSGK